MELLILIGAGIIAGIFIWANAEIDTSDEG